jgi:glycosyltransferase involved in cell wall biosynthesis
MEQVRNVSFLLGSLTGVGGTARAVSILANELVKTQKFRISVICYFQKENSQHYPLDDSINVSVILSKSISMRKAFLKVLYYLIKYIRLNKVDVLVASGSIFFPVAIIAARLTRCRVICSDHSNYLSTLGFKHERKARDFAAKYSDFLITLTNTDRENYIRNTKVYTIIDSIPNIMDDRLFTRNGKYNFDSHKIISVGRLTYAKNYELLIDIAEIILKKYPDWSWDIYGDGELQSKLEKKISELDIKRLLLKGAEPNIYDVYQEYAFLVLTSRYEGYPMVLLESIAKKVPVVSFDCPTGPSEIVDDKVTGLLIKDNNVSEMVDAIEYLIINQTERIRMSNSCESALSKFTKSEIILKWCDYLSK